MSYVVTSFITMAPGALAYTWLGYAGREALGGNASAIRYGLLALGLLAAIVFLPNIALRLASALRRPISGNSAELVNTSKMAFKKDCE